MRIKEGLVIRKINNFYAVIPSDKKTVDFHGMMTLNESGKKLYDALKNDISIDDLARLLYETYDIDQKQALEDVEVFIERLENHQLLVK